MIGATFFRRCVFILSISTALFMPFTVLAQCGGSIQPRKFEEDELLEAGIDAYRELPKGIGLEHAPCFSNALSYLFAYEQRLSDRGSGPEGDIREVIDWLTRRLNLFMTGKGDRIQSREDKLFDKGNYEYKILYSNFEGGNEKIWNVKAYISASAYLFAYLQVADNPNPEAIRALNWLQERRGRLVRAAGKGDRLGAAGSESWVPRGEKPSLKAEFGTENLQPMTVSPQPMTVHVEEKSTDEEDCLSINSSEVQIQYEGNREYLITDGESRIAIAADRTSARKMTRIVAQHEYHCFIGRDNQREDRSQYLVEYWKGRSDVDVHHLRDEDCLPYNPDNLRIVDEQEQGYLLTDGRSRMLILDDRNDAERALEWAKQHSKHCFIGRDNDRENRDQYILEYWK